MKKILIILFTIGAMSFISCKDFLTIIPTDAMFLEDVPAIKTTLGAYLDQYYKNSTASKATNGLPGTWLGYGMGATYIAYDDVWTFDNWSERELSDTDRRYIARAVMDQPDWSCHYSIIGFMNLILSEIDDASGDNTMRDYVKGEALIHRAHSFFRLLQLYSPMNDPSMGIPIRVDIYGGFEDTDLSRKTQQQVYDQIFADLNEAEKLLGRTFPNPTYNLMYDYNYLWRIRAKVYQWKASGPCAADEDWAKTAEAARKAIEYASDALPLTVARLNSFFVWDIAFQGGIANGFFPEFLHLVLNNNGSGTRTSYNFKRPLYQSLYKTYDERKAAWFNDTETGITLTKNVASGGFMPFQTTWTLRYAETYLILIEACAHTGEYDEGMEYLRKWQSVRYAADTQSEWPNPANAAELLEEVKLERKREFVFEGDINWLDMKRFGTTEGPRGTSKYTAPALSADDIRYSFRIPDSETDTNRQIIQNPGWEAYSIIRDDN